MAFSKLSDLFPEGQRRSLEAENRVREAYVALFAGNGGQEDADLVLLDLLTVSGYLFVSEPPPGAEAASDAVLREQNGARRVGARVMYQLNWPMSRLKELQSATLEEGIVEANEGVY